MSTKRLVPIWKCENCGTRAEKLNLHGYCSTCGSAAIAMDLGDAEYELAEAMKGVDIKLDANQATMLLAAVTKVLNEWEEGNLRSITPVELSALQEMRGALMGITVRN